MTLEKARQADREGRFVDAARLYERSVQEKPQAVDAWLDLLGLYWQATEFGTVAALHLSHEFVDRAAKRQTEILRILETRFPEDPRSEFWRWYIPYRELGDEPPETETIRGRFQSNPDVLENAMYLFSTTQDEQYRPAVMKLLRQSKASSTALSRYVASFVESCLNLSGS